MIPWSDVSHCCPIGPVVMDVVDVMRSVVEVDIAVDLPLVIEDVDFPGRYPMLGDPGVRVVSCPIRF